jgi:hypothetical protein
LRYNDILPLIGSNILLQEVICFGISTLIAQEKASPLLYKFQAWKITVVTVTHTVRKVAPCFCIVARRQVTQQHCYKHEQKQGFERRRKRQVFRKTDNSKTCGGNLVL